jgi:holo-[acyl-carrier protein] synthase
MDLVGIGTQIVECPRVRKLIDRHGEVFLTQVYTERELIYCRDRSHSTEYYAAIWAAKEAVFRSLGTKWKRGVCWQDVEIVCDTAIEPRALVTGPTKELLDGRGVTNILVTFAYTRLYATATAVAVK